MTTKRKQTDSEATPSSKRQRSKRHEPEPPTTSQSRVAKNPKPPINPLKRRIRSLTRLLNDPSKSSAQSPVQKQTSERELAGLRHSLAEAQRSAARTRAIGKWHMVRFFDRRKAERRLKAAKKDTSGPPTNAERRIWTATVDMQYALNFPLEMPYASLWPRAGQQQQEEAKGDRVMWALVEKCLREGRLEQLRDGRAPELQTRDKRKEEARPDQSSDKVDHHKESDQDSDGGFFE